MSHGWTALLLLLAAALGPGTVARNASRGLAELDDAGLMAHVESSWRCHGDVRNIGFIHLPKTAGGSLHDAFRAVHTLRYVHYGADFNQKLKIRAGCNASEDTELKPCVVNDIKHAGSGVIFGGHVRLGTEHLVLDGAAGRTAGLVTVLREPVSWLVSRHSYLSNVNSPAFAKFKTMSCIEMVRQLDGEQAKKLGVRPEKAMTTWMMQLCGHLCAKLYRDGALSTEQAMSMVVRNLYTRFGVVGTLEAFGDFVDLLRARYQPLRSVRVTASKHKSSSSAKSKCKEELQSAAGREAIERSQSAKQLQVVYAHAERIFERQKQLARECTR